MPEKYTAKPTEAVIETVINDVEAFLVEGGKIARKTSMEVFWGTGEMLRGFEKRFKVNISALVSKIATDNRISGRQMGERNIWFALKFYEAFPVFDKVYDTEFGENISLSKVKKLLVTPKPKKEKSVKEMAITIVETLGVEKALELAEEIKKECKAQSKKA